MSATVPSPTPAESACPCLPPPQTRLGRRGAGAALADPPALSRRLGTREGGHALPGGRLGRPGLTVPASPPVPEEAEAPPRPLPTDAQDLGSVSHGWREQTCRLACAPFTPRDPPADTNTVVTTPCPPCPQGSPGPGPAAQMPRRREGSCIGAKGRLREGTHEDPWREEEAAEASDASPGTSGRGGQPLCAAGFMLPAPWTSGSLFLSTLLSLTF